MAVGQIYFRITGQIKFGQNHYLNWSNYIWSKSTSELVELNLGQNHCLYWSLITRTDRTILELIKLVVTIDELACLLADTFSESAK